MSEYPEQTQGDEEYDAPPNVLDTIMEPDQEDPFVQTLDVSEGRYGPNRRALMVRRSIEVHRERAALRALIDESFYEPWGERDRVPTGEDQHRLID